MPNRDDETLLRAYAQEGDESAFRELARRHGGLVYAACLRETRRPELAEDAAQAVFLDLARKAGRIRVGSSLVPWLYAASRLAGKKAARAERRRPTVALAETVPAPPNPPPDDALFQALDALGGPEREAVVLRFVQGLSLAEVGRAQGVSEDAARMRVKRALARLRTEYVPALAAPAGLTERLATLALPQPSPLMTTPFLLASGGAAVLSVVGAAATIRRPTPPAPRPSPAPILAPAQTVAARKKAVVRAPKPPKGALASVPALDRAFTLTYHFTQRDLRPKAVRDAEADRWRRQLIGEVDADRMTAEQMEKSVASMRNLRPPYSKDVTLSFDGRTLYVESDGETFLLRRAGSYHFPPPGENRYPGFSEWYDLYVVPVPNVGPSLPYLPLVEGGQILIPRSAPRKGGKPFRNPGWVEAKGGKVVRIVEFQPGAAKPFGFTALSDHRRVNGFAIAGSVLSRYTTEDGQLGGTEEFRLTSASDRPLPATRFDPESYLPEKTDFFVSRNGFSTTFPYERAKGPLDAQVAAFIARGGR